jgi:hypothetical protein
MMTFLQKGYIFIAGLSILILTSCKNTDYDVIPDVFIDFTIDLLDPEFAALTVIGISDTIDASTNNWGYKSAGYDNNGIIIYSGPDEYLAYDRTCPHDFSVNNLSVAVKAYLSVAECPVCGTKYTLSGYGSPLSGIGKYPLKSYKTSFEENRYIRVWNK